MQDATKAVFHLPAVVFPAIAFSFVSFKRPPYVIFTEVLSPSENLCFK
jgi:hypothetical protein